MNNLMQSPVDGDHSHGSGEYGSMTPVLALAMRITTMTTVLAQATSMTTMTTALAQATRIT